MQAGFPAPYVELAQRVYSGWESSETTRVSDVTEAIWRAVNDPSSPLSIPAGADAVALRH